MFLGSRLVNLIDLLFPLTRITRYPLPTFSIYGLTKSRIQSLTPVALSIIAFVFGIVTIVTTAWSPQCGFSC
jgi:hypothetical protein